MILTLRHNSGTYSNRVMVLGPGIEDEDDVVKRAFFFYERDPKGLE